MHTGLVLVRQERHALIPELVSQSNAVSGRIESLMRRSHELQVTACRIARFSLRVQASLGLLNPTDTANNTKETVAHARPPQEAQAVLSFSPCKTELRFEMAAANSAREIRNLDDDKVHRLNIKYIYWVAIRLLIHLGPARE